MTPRNAASAPSSYSVASAAVCGGRQRYIETLIEQGDVMDGPQPAKPTQERLLGDLREVIENAEELLKNTTPVSYTHLTLPTIYSV